MATRTPPRFVPTLTEVVRPDAPAPAGTLPEAPRAPAPAPATIDATQAEEQMVHRVMQRIDLSLERQLREAIADTVLQQTRELVPVLREHIEDVVRHAVSEAFAAELQADPRQRR